MKKLIGLLLISLAFMTGCDIKELSNNDINKVVNTVLNQNLNLYSQTSNGYKYYVPRGVMVTDSTSYNEKLYSSGDVYYLYVDVVSYYFKRDSNYVENKNAYFSKKLNYKNKKGYLEITKINNLYFIEMMYNYAKVEALVSKDDIVSTIINSSYILNSLKFNDKIIKLMFDENILNFNEEQYKLLEPKQKEGDFLDYVKEYDQYEENIDEDLITPDESTSTDQTIDNSLE